MRVFSFFKRWFTSESPDIRAPLAEIRPVNGPAQFSFLVGSLPRAILRDWPSFSLEDQPDEARPLMEERKRNWERAAREGGRHWIALREMQGWSPYPTESLCLGDAELTDDGKMVRIGYFLFPTSAPTERAHAVAHLIYEAQVGAGPGEFERLWIEALRDEDLSEESRRRIREATR